MKMRNRATTRKEKREKGSSISPWLFLAIKGRDRAGGEKKEGKEKGSNVHHLRGKEKGGEGGLYDHPRRWLRRRVKGSEVNNASLRPGWNPT